MNPASPQSDLPTLGRLAVSLHQTGRPREALDVFLRMLAIDSRRAEIWNAAAVCLQETSQPARAVEFYLRAVGLRPDFPEAWNNLAVLQIRENDFAGAVESLERALSAAPGFLDALNNLGIARRGVFQYHEAIATFRRAHELEPDNAAIRGALGEALSLVYDHEAESHLRAAVCAQPNDPASHINLALDLLKHGRYDEGFREFEWRAAATPANNPMQRFPQPVWRGEAVDPRATLLLHAEQGFGDAIQFARYIPAALERFAEVTVEVPPELLRLFQAFEPANNRLHVIASGTPVPVFDWHCPMLSLGLVLPAVPPPVRLTPPRLHMPGRRIGIAWAGNAMHARDRERSVPFEALLPLFALEGFEWVSLQTGARHADAARNGIRLEQPGLADFLATAELLDTLDHVIAPDSAVAHLALTQGIPTSVLLPYVADWRWGLPNGDSPWYPEAHLARQTHEPAGEPQAELWQPVITALRNSLTEKLTNCQGKTRAQTRLR